MENNFFVWGVIIVFLCIALALAVVLKKKGILSNTITNYIAALANIAVILTLAYAIFSYTHTIYPVFEKEQRLTIAEQEVIKLRGEIETKERSLEILTRNYENVNTDFLLLKEEYSNVLQKNYTFENQTKNLNFKIWSTEKDAVRTIAVYEVDLIIAKSISLYKNDAENYQERIIEVALQGIQQYKSGSVEYKAYSLLQKFAQEQMASDSTYNDALNIRIFFYEEYDKLYPPPD